jgi:phytoene synthase
MRLEIPKHLLSDLLDGMQMDVEGYSERCWQDLDRYCYGVAGTVGLMMCYVMGIRDERAFPYAIALGKAMQLTNIVRDFRSDLERGRCYVPIEWRHKNASFEAQKKDWPLFADRLIRLASEGYETGRRGIGFLPFRAGLAIQIASLVYEKIGEKILAQKEQAWETRCYTTKAEKLWIALRESLLWIFTYPRLRKNLFRSKLSPP